MKAETANCLAKARRCLDRANNIAALPEPEVAAREAYLAAYHAAEAYIFERTGKGVKTHRGLRATFSRLDAAVAIDTAGRFIDAITQLLLAGSSPPQ